MKYWLQILKAKVKGSLNLPITRVDVLKLAKAKLERNPEKYSGLCSLLSHVFDNYNIYPSKIEQIFPLYTPKNAKPFGATEEYGYWWESQGWNNGRLDFLNWLIEQYKEDKTDING